MRKGIKSDFDIFEILGPDVSFIPKTINSENDFIAIECPEHGLYYIKVQDLVRRNQECPRCQFLDEKRQERMLMRAKHYGDLGWLAFYRQNRHQSEIFHTNAIFYRLHITHKETQFQFQKIGVLSPLDDESTGDICEDFDRMWDPWKWKNFKIEVVDKIECSLLEAHTIEALFQKDHAELKITVPSYLGFNKNKTYLPDFIIQARSKTIKPLRDALLHKQKGICTICGKEAVNPTLDHEHIKKIKGTGFIRGVTCAQCNTFIARAENNAARHGLNIEELPTILRRMANHLEQRKDIIHPSEIPPRKKVGAREWNRVKKYYFDVFPNRKKLPKKPTYVTENWKCLVQQIDTFLKEKEINKKRRKKQWPD